MLSPSIRRSPPGFARRHLPVLAVVLAALIGLPSGAAATIATGNNGVRLWVASSVVQSRTKVVLITVKGSGYSTTANNGFGIYLSFGERPSRPGRNDAWARDTTRYHDAGEGRGTKWIHPDTPSGANQAKLKADGTFKTTLAVKASFLARNGTRYPQQRPLGVLTYAAHGMETLRDGSGDRVGTSQYAFLRLRFVAPSSLRPKTSDPAAMAAPGAGRVTAHRSAPRDADRPLRPARTPRPVGGRRRRTFGEP